MKRFKTCKKQINKSKMMKRSLISMGSALLIHTGVWHSKGKGHAFHVPTMWIIPVGCANFFSRGNLRDGFIE